MAAFQKGQMMPNGMIKTTPLKLPRSVRRDVWRGISSMRAGVDTPIAFFPLLREDALRGSLVVQVRMAEAVRTILNPIRVTVQAHLVGKVAMSRFDGSIETLNRSFMGETLPGGGPAPAWDVPDGNLAGLAADDAGHPIFDKLGIHYKKSDRISADLVEAYNLIVNWRRRAVSAALPQRSLTDPTLARSLWDNRRLDHIKPSFDAAMMEGIVPIGIDGLAPVSGELFLGGGDATGAAAAQVFTQGADTATVRETGKNGVRFTFGENGLMHADLSGATGASISLANIELAKKTQQFAKMREMYQGIPDEYLIDMLMQGLRVPEDVFKEPILIGYGSALIGQMQRYATDADNLDVSVTNGMARLSMTLNTPQVSTGGFVIVTCSIIPEQLYERIEDTALVVNAAGDASDLPNALNDFLDPQKVEIVTNRYADVLHATPDAVFGYQPLNADWMRMHSRVGGKFKRPVNDAFVEDRQRIWAVEKANPTLSEDFYLCPSPFPHTVFADSAADPFEVIVVAPTSIRGLTVFGQGFEEDGDHYDKIIAGVDTGRIESHPVGTVPTVADEAVVEDATDA